MPDWSTSDWTEAELTPPPGAEDDVRRREAALVLSGSNRWAARYLACRAAREQEARRERAATTPG